MRSVTVPVTDWDPGLAGLNKELKSESGKTDPRYKVVRKEQVSTAGSKARSSR